MRLFSLFALILVLTLPVAAFAEDEEEAAEGEEVQLQSAYHSLKPSLTTNVQGGAKYVRCDVQLMTKDDRNLEQIQLHSPALRHELLLLLGDQEGGKLKTPAGKEAFRKQALKSVGKVMEKLTGSNSIDGLFFTAFFVQ
jgi:flagellar FliL protein